jgi:integrase
MASKPEIGGAASAQLKVAEEAAHRTQARGSISFLRDCGITPPGKVVHSLRHRAADRLRAAGAPVDIQHALLGHETRSVAEGYGAGHPVVLLKKRADKIGL